MKRTLALGLLLGLLLPVASSAVVREETLKSRVKAWAAGEQWNLSAGYSLVKFSDPVWETVLDKENLPLTRFGFGWYPLDNFALEFTMGGMYEKAEAVGSVSGERSGEKFTLWIIPVELGVRYRLKFLENQLVVPSVFAAYEWWYYNENPDFGETVEGNKIGWRYGADLGLLLDKFDPDAAHRFQRDYGVTDTYLCLGYEVLDMGAMDGLDFSGEMYTLSLRFDLGPTHADAKP